MGWEIGVGCAVAREIECRVVTGWDIGAGFVLGWEIECAAAD